MDLTDQTMEPTDPEGTDEGAAEDPAVGDDLPNEAYNLVPMIQGLKKALDDLSGQEWLDKQARLILDTTKLDEDGREKFMERRANQSKLYAGIMDPLGFPAEGGKAPHLPILLQAMLSLWSRIWDQVCPAKGDVVHVDTVGIEDQARQIRVEKHMNWQVRTKMPDWASGLASSIMQWLLSGSMFRDGCWDPIEKRTRIDQVPIDDFVLPYTDIDLHPLMPTVSRKTRKKRVAKHIMLQYEELGYYTGVRELYGNEKTGDAPATTGNSNYTEVSKVKKVSDEIDGVDRPLARDFKDPDAKREIYERQQWMEIPGVTKKNDKGEDVQVLKPVKITVDVASKKILSLCLHEVDDPVDAARFMQETQAHQALVQQLTAPPQPGPPGAQPPVSPGPSLPPQHAMSPMTPPVPQLPPPPKPIRQVPLYTTIHYRLFPNPDGIYGLGAGYLLENANDLVDELVADVLVSGKFQNMQMGFISKHAQGANGGDVRMVPGKFMSIDCQPDELDKAVKPFQFGAPSATLTNLAKLLMDESKSQAANQEILSGEQGGSRETAKSMQIRTGNAMQVVNVMTRLFLEPLKYEFKLMAHENSVFMDENEEFYVTEPSKQVPQQQVKQKYSVSRADYLEDYDITFTADARVSSKEQRVGDAMGLVDKVTQTPAIIQSPTGQMLLHLVVENLFKEMERPDFLAAWGPPPQPSPPPTPMDQYDENAGFLNEKDHPVLPDDNHLEHIAKIEEFKASPHSKSLSSTGKQMLDKHVRAHVAASYQQTVKGENNAQPQQAPQMGQRPGGAGGVPQRPNNGAPPGGPPGGRPTPPAQPPGPMQNGTPGRPPV